MVAAKMVYCWILGWESKTWGSCPKPQACHGRVPALPVPLSKQFSGRANLASKKIIFFVSFVPFH